MADPVTAKLAHGASAISGAQNTVNQGLSAAGAAMLGSFRDGTFLAHAVNAQKDARELTDVKTERLLDLNDKLRTALNPDGRIGELLTNDGKRKDVVEVLKGAQMELQKLVSAEVIDGKVQETLVGVSKLLRIAQSYPQIMIAATVPSVSDANRDLSIQGNGSDKMLNSLANTQQMQLRDRTHTAILGEFGATVGAVYDNLQVALPYAVDKIGDAHTMIAASTPLKQGDLSK